MEVFDLTVLYNFDFGDETHKEKLTISLFDLLKNNC